MSIHPNYIYIYAFSRRCYPKRFTVHSGYTYMCSLGIEPTTFALLTQCSTTEPQEHYKNNYIFLLSSSFFQQLSSETSYFMYKIQAKISNSLFFSLFEIVIMSLKLHFLRFLFLFILIDSE